MNKRAPTDFFGLLATDLDGTLVGEPTGCQALFSHLLNQPGKVGLAYITGRHYASACALIEQEDLLWPDFLITDVGTVIHRFEADSTGVLDKGNPIIDQNWQKTMTRNWDAAAVRSVAARIPGLYAQNLPNEHRVSFHVKSRSPAVSFRHQLETAGLRFTYVFSSGRDIDVLPEGGGKGEALKHLIKAYIGPPARILAAGDSGNDREMIEAGFPAVIVANAQPELRRVPANPLVYRAEKSFAWGILEGWKHFHD